MDNQNEETNLQENQIGGDISQIESCDFCHNNSILLKIRLIWPYFYRRSLYENIISKLW